MDREKDLTHARETIDKIIDVLKDVDREITTTRLSNHSDEEYDSDYIVSTLDLVLHRVRCYHRFIFKTVSCDIFCHPSDTS